MAPDDTSTVPLPLGTCPLCGKPTVRAHRPLCSARCRSIDLGRWLRGVYVIETDETPEDGAGEPG